MLNIDWTDGLLWFSLAGSLIVILAARAQYYKEAIHERKPSILFFAIAGACVTVITSFYQNSDSNMKSIAARKDAKDRDSLVQHRGDSLHNRLFSNLAREFNNQKISIDFLTNKVTTLKDSIASMHGINRGDR